MLIECQKCHEAHPTKLCPHAFMIVDDAPKKMTMEDFISLEEQYGCTLAPGCTGAATELLPCGHPKSSLYEGKYTVEGGECTECGAEYVKGLK